MKRLFTLLFIVASVTLSIAQNGFDRWMPTSGTDTYSTNITGHPGTYNNTIAYVKFGNANTGASTLAVNSMAAKAIRLWDGDSWEPVTSGQLPAGSNAILTYDNTNGYYKAVVYENIGTGSGGGVESVSGDGVDNTDPLNPVIDLSSYYSSSETDNVVNTSFDNSITYFFNDQTDDYTLVLSDFETPTYLRLTKTGTATITIPDNDDVAIPEGRTLLFKKIGTGDITFSPDVDAIIIPSSGSYTSKPNQLVVLVKEGPDLWSLSNGTAIDAEDLGLVPDTRQVAGFDLTDDITIAELRTALGVPTRSYVASASDVTNSTTSLADATDYSFSGLSGEKYHFKFVIPYNSSISTNGSRWSVNCANAPTYLRYRVSFVNTSVNAAFHMGGSTTEQAFAESAGTFGDPVCIIEGEIQFSANNTLIARFASEIATTQSISVKRNGFGYVEIRLIP